MVHNINDNQKHSPGIYRISSKVNPFKLYIGSTNCLITRYYGHVSDLRRNKHRNSKLQNHFNKYEDDLFFEVIDICEIKNLIEFEQLVLDEYRSHIMYDVFNVTFVCEGRYGMTHSVETKNKISLKKKGVPSGRLGEKCSAELRKKLSIAHTGLPSPMKGTKRPIEFIESTRDRLKKLGPEGRKLILKNAHIAAKKSWIDNKKQHIEKRLKNKPQCKHIIQCDLSGNEINRFHGVKYAAIELGVQRSGISFCLINKGRQRAGFTWRYA